MHVATSQEPISIGGFVFNQFLPQRFIGRKINKKIYQKKENK